MAERDFVVVGLGASAGGIQAVRTFFERVPKDSGLAYVVILHLSPEHESHLAEVLQTSASIPVVQVSERVRVEPNRVYVIPPNQRLSMGDGHLALSDVGGAGERRAPVDFFFRTLGDSQGAHAACVILSGTGANGSMGLKRVKERGGLCLAQDPSEAQHDDMPRAAMATGLVDHVVRAADMPAILMAFSRAVESLPAVDDPAARTAPDEHALREIFREVRRRTGHEFSNYKRSTVIRRIARRIAVHQLSDVPAYARYLFERPDETRALLKDLLISVTHFFRDPEAFAALEQLVVPRLFEGRSEEDQIRVWVPGCATGEEAYSIAVLLAERAADLPRPLLVQVFATDIDEEAMTAAREGVYTLNDAADVPPERLRRFFVAEGQGYVVRKELREMILFAHHNILRDPPFAHLDLVSCRNLLIYLNPSAQERLLDVVHFALRPGGYLFLGTAESIEGRAELFVPVDREAHLFQSRGVPARIPIPLPGLTVGGHSEPPAAGPRAGQPISRERLSFGELHYRLLEQYAPPSILVNEAYDIVHLSEHAGRYLYHAGGEPSRNLVTAVRPDLRLELRTALYQAAQQRVPVQARGVRCQIGDRTEVIDLVVRPVLRPDDPARGYFVVLFVDSTVVEVAAPAAVVGANRS